MHSTKTLPPALTLLSKKTLQEIVVHVSLRQGVGTCQNSLFFSLRPVEHCVLSAAFYTSLSAFGKVPPYLL